MLVITMLLARTWKDEGIQRCHPRYEYNVSVNSRVNQVQRISSVRLHMSQVSVVTMSWVLKNRLRSCTRVPTVHAVLNTKLQYETEHIGIWCSRTQKCSQRFEIEYFWYGSLSAIQTSKFFFNAIGEASVLFLQHPIYL